MIRRGQESLALSIELIELHLDFRTRYLGNINPRIGMPNKAKAVVYARPPRSWNPDEPMGGRFPKDLESWRGSRAGPPEG
jgi:hypothetical protein